MARKSVFPWVLAGLGAAALVKGFFRPYRAVAKNGTVARCSGKNQLGICDPADAISVAKGDAVYSTGGGQVVAVGDNFVNLLVSNEPIILMYDGIAPGVQKGQYVGKGQTIGRSLGTVYFSVSELMPGGKAGAFRIVSLPPSAWLAARGMRDVVKNTGAGNKWCEQGRKINVPTEATRTCKLGEPDPAGFALLPVTVTMQG